MKHLVALDWGTTSLRGALLADDGRTLDERSLPRGILSVEPGAFRNVFDDAFGDWMRAPRSFALICGMAGSRQGWIEAPYCPCPAGFEDIVAHLAPVDAGRIAIVPGLRCEHDGVPDVMRGEETQVFGALEQLGLDAGTFVLPGTHSKWVHVQGGRIESFSTCMTGEVYALLRSQSILARSMPPADGEADMDAFERGVGHALAAPGLLQSAFSARTLALFDRVGAQALPSYLSGVVIGEEIRSQRLASRARGVTLIGSAALTLRYEAALRCAGIGARRIGGEATWHGLRAIARAARIA